MDFGGFYFSRILIVRGGIPRPIGNFPESLSQAILVGIILVGRRGMNACKIHSVVGTGRPQKFACDLELCLPVSVKKALL